MEGRLDVWSCYFIFSSNKRLVTIFYKYIPLYSYQTLLFIACVVLKFEFLAVISGFLTELNWAESGFCTFTIILKYQVLRKNVVWYEISYPYKCLSGKEKRSKRSFPFHKKTIGHSSSHKQINTPLDWSTIVSIISFKFIKKNYGELALAKNGVCSTVACKSFRIKGIPSYDSNRSPASF